MIILVMYRHYLNIIYHDCLSTAGVQLVEIHMVIYREYAYARMQYNKNDVNSQSNV